MQRSVYVLMPVLITMDGDGTPLAASAPAVSYAKDLIFGECQSVVYEFKRDAEDALVRMFAKSRDTDDQ